MTHPDPQWGPPTAPPAPQWGPPPGWVPGPPPPPPTTPLEPTGYHQFWRAPGIAAWRPIVAAVLVALAFFLSSVVVTGIAMFIEVATGALDPDEMDAILYDGRVTPGMILGNSVAIGLMVPAVLLIARIVRQRPGFLHSVAGRFRWAWFWLCALASLVVLGLSTGVDILRTGVGELDLQIHPYTWWLLVGIMLATPFQAAAEEYMFRGVLFRTVGSWFRRPMVALGVGTVVNTAVFMSIHGAEDPWLNAFYIVLAALLSYLTWRTGGIEAAAAVHIVNNMIGFSLVPFQDVSGIFDRSAGVGGPFVLWQVLATVILVGIIELLARRRRIERLGPPELVRR